MAVTLALLLYAIGFAATATSPLEDGRLLDKPVWLTLAVALAWPALAVLTTVLRVWRKLRG